MENLTFAVPTLFGLEGLCADEMRRLGLPQVQAENGRVLCGGTWADLPRLNLNLRTGERVLIVLGTLPRRGLRGPVPGAPRPALGASSSPRAASSP